jgi:hypothetical protein
LPIEPARVSAPRARWLTGAALLLIAASAVALQRGATAPWGRAATASGDLRLSPIGLVRLSGDETVTECRWWPTLGEATLCGLAPGGEAAMARLRRAYPLAVVAMWTAILALFLNVLALPRRVPWAGALVTAIGSALAASSVWSVASAPRALAALQAATVRFDQAGFLCVAGAALFTAAATVLLAAARRSRPGDPSA